MRRRALASFEGHCERFPEFGEIELAIKPSDPDTFLREVDEELRKERLNKFVSRYGWAIVGAVVLLLGAVGGYIWWQDRQQAAGRDPGRGPARGARRHGERQPQRRRRQDRSSSPRATSKAIVSPPCSRALPRQAEAGQNPAAIATLKSIADNQDIAEPYRQAALVRQTALEFDQLQPRVVIQRLGPLARPGQAWFGTAGEMVGIAHLRMRRPDLAGPLFKQIGRGPDGAGVDPYKGRSDGRVFRFQRRPRAERSTRRATGGPAKPGASEGKSRMKRVVIALTAISLLGGCGLFGGRGPTTPTVGERIPVLGTEGQVEVDPALADVPVTVPGPFVNTDWAQPGGNASKSVGHVALGDIAEPGLERQHRLGQQRPGAARRRAGRRRRPGLHDRHAGDGARLQRRQWRPDLVDPGPRREFAERDPVRRRRQLRQWPGLRHQRRRRCRRARRGDRRRSCGWSSRAGRCAARRPSPTTMSMSISQDSSALRAQRRQRRDALDRRRRVRAGRRVRHRRARLRAKHGGRRLLVGRAHRLSLRERPGRLAGCAVADRHQHPASAPSPTSTPTR